MGGAGQLLNFVHVSHAADLGISCSCVLRLNQRNPSLFVSCLFLPSRTPACAQNNSQIRPSPLRSPSKWPASIKWLCLSTKSQSGFLGPLKSRHLMMMMMSICRIGLIESNVLFRYLAQVMKLSFTREAHVKKYKKLMKLDLPAELESLRWDPKWPLRPLLSFSFPVSLPLLCPVFGRPLSHSLISSPCRVHMAWVQEVVKIRTN